MKRKRKQISATDVFIALLMLAIILVSKFSPEHTEPPPQYRQPSLANDSHPMDISDVGKIALSSGQALRERDIERGALELFGGRRSGVVYLNWNQRPLTPLASGVDDKMHFVNAYLVGYVPDPKAPPWAPLYVLASRKIYQTDLAQYHREDVWQTSYQAMNSERGDCEDHALALADWLIGLGMDARVVIGKMKGEGHAWVVVREGQRTFLLEATNKRRQRSWAYPLAILHPEYQPHDMFNRTQWWRQSGGPTTDYSDARWTLGATYRSK